jgi:hypothetical protein
MTLAGLVRSRDRLMGIGQAITMPRFFASNVLYPVDVMPSWLHVPSTFNPLDVVVFGGRGHSRNYHCVNAFAAPGRIGHECVTPPAEFDSAGAISCSGGSESESLSPGNASSLNR